MPPGSTSPPSPTVRRVLELLRRRRYITISITTTSAMTTAATMPNIITVLDPPLLEDEASALGGCVATIDVAVSDWPWNATCNAPLLTSCCTCAAASAVPMFIVATVLPADNTMLSTLALLTFAATSADSTAWRSSAASGDESDPNMLKSTGRTPCTGHAHTRSANDVRGTSDTAGDTHCVAQNAVPCDSDMYRPYWHAWHTLSAVTLPGAACPKPTPHVVHIAHDPCPLDAWKVPVPHGWHGVDGVWSKSANPGGHGTHGDVDDAGPYVPTGHATHDPVPVPVASYVPAAHAWHCGDDDGCDMRKNR